MKANEKVVIRIVDDDPAIHDSLGLIFDMAGMIVRHYYSGEEFLAADFLNDAGCAVVDLRMGGMSGLELQQKLKSAGCGLPLIFEPHSVHRRRPSSRNRRIRRLPDLLRSRRVRSASLCRH